MAVINLILYAVAAVFMMVCIGTTVGALSKAKDDRKKAGDMGLTGLAFCMLAVLFFLGAKFIPSGNAPKAAV